MNTSALFSLYYRELLTHTHRKRTGDNKQEDKSGGREAVINFGVARKQGSTGQNRLDQLLHDYVETVVGQLYEIGLCDLLYNEIAYLTKSRV